MSFQHNYQRKKILGSSLPDHWRPQDIFPGGGGAIRFTYFQVFGSLEYPHQGGSGGPLPEKNALQEAEQGTIILNN